MNADQILDMIGDARGEYILQAQQHRAGAAPKIRLSLNRSLLIAALIAAMLLLVGCTIAYTQGWFLNYFQKNTDTPLTPEQISYIEENEQVIGETKAQNGWTVELRSAINDGTTGYIIIGVTAPKGTNLEPRIENDRILDMFTPGNVGMSNLGKGQSVITPSEGIRWTQIAMSWEEDGDGLDHTKNYVIQIYPDLAQSTKDPFGTEAVYHICIENIVREYDDEEYRQQLMDTKYKDQNAIMFTQEEIERMSKVDVLVEGIWEFDVTFSSGTQEIELLTQPVKASALITYSVDPFSPTYSEDHQSYEEVTLTSVILRPLTVVFHYADCGGSASFTRNEEMDELLLYAVMKDGNQIALLPFGSQGKSFQTLEAETPLILSEVDHILMGDGTIIPVPAQ